MQRGAAVGVIALQLALGAAGCKPAPTKTGGGADSVGLTAEQRAAGWRSLFDGRTLAGWRGYRTKTVPAGWRAEDGVLTKDSATGDLITTDHFVDFELAFDWKLSPGGNAGVFYRGTPEYDHIYWSAPEYQLLDDAGHVDGKNRLTAAGAVFALYPAPAGVVKPANEWNSSRIVARRNHVEHWLNDQKLLEYEFGSTDWSARVKASKFVDYPHYGASGCGEIGIQGDHEGTLSLRNIHIKTRDVPYPKALSRLQRSIDSASAAERRRKK
jgi:hypothetical protein